MSDPFDLGSVEVSLSPIERFEEFLQSRGKRMTQQRRIIVEEVFRRHEHFNAEELCDQLGRAGRDVSRPTVYRTLNELEDSGLLRKMPLAGRRVYEHDYGYPQHDHLHCEKCNKLIEFQSDELLDLRNRLARDANFRPTGHRLIVTGMCADCAKSRRRPRRLELV